MVPCPYYLIHSTVCRVYGFNLLALCIIKQIRWHEHILYAEVHMHPATGLATCGTALWNIQPLPSVTLTHLKPDGEDPEMLHTHLNDVVRSDNEQLGLDFNGIEKVTRDH